MRYHHTLAHTGALFLDELAEFSPQVLETLREPLEEGWVTISRAGSAATYPARFTLIAAMNPCPRGSYVAIRARSRRRARPPDFGKGGGHDGGWGVVTAARDEIGTALPAVPDWRRGTTIHKVHVCMWSGRGCFGVVVSSHGPKALTPLMAHRLASALEAAASEAERCNRDAFVARAK